MKTLVTLAAAIPLAAATPTDRPYYAGMPPERYQGEGVAVVLFVNDVRQYCHAEVPPGYTLLACAGERDGVPTIVLPDPCPFGAAGEMFATLACHEKAHSSHNWPGNHPE